jgi:pyruvate/2-oxoglutarate/acetoin dehydrogenase E1 component
MRMTFAEACIDAIAGEMRDDDRVFVMGQDVGRFGGPLRSTDGLHEAFGDKRVIDMPMSESAIMGAAIGAALEGKRPIVELMFLEFLPLIMQQLVDGGAMHYYSGGAAKIPVVVRAKFGVGPFHGHAYDFHSWATHVPGVKVVAPATPGDAKGLMTAAIRDPNPVLFIEHMGLYHSVREEIASDPFTIPIGKARVAREGSDITLIAYGFMVRKALQLAKTLEARGISAHILDLRTIAPLDEPAIADAVARTGRVVILSEAILPGGSHHTIAGYIAQNCFADLRGPVQISCPPAVPVPFHRALEKAYLPDEADMMDAIERTGLRVDQR